MPKVKSDEKDPPADGASGAGDGAGDDGAGGGDGAVTRDDVREVVEDAVPRILERLLGDDGDGAGDGAGGDDGGDDGTTRARSPKAVELDVGRQVREELARVKEGEELRGKVEHLEEVIAEKTPRKLSRFARAMWGSDDE